MGGPGTHRDRRSLGSPTWSTPTVVEGVVYMGSNGWYLWAVDAAGTVYVSSLDDFVYAIHT
ncbi:PQQ-binding-like beta-propeller repeat protein [Streptomyces sp. NPDC048277]|uniref:PQQ-binding-like beta-propeller repeat protein n=1 Tax=Streptomyces sp. NPDC048277 TaxID=3155027 RepID=UPI0033DCE616